MKKTFHVSKGLLGEIYNRTEFLAYVGMTRNGCYTEFFIQSVSVCISYYHRPQVEKLFTTWTQLKANSEN